ncbi:MAG: hypothetical protein ACRC1T_05295 [Clostridium chrysemydis]|uniref:hypothetical protein n=1 Tax=Clostridium chrysemydis TaxID=2665504 RepID=UPI003F3D033C
MIYQMTIYYGAKINGDVIYSTEIHIEDCTKFPKDIDGNIYRKQLEELIIRDGFNPGYFEFGFLTKSEYENRTTKDNENSTNYKISK